MKRSLLLLLAAISPLAFTTAKDARNILSTLDLAQTLFKQAQGRVTTGQLNRAIEEIIADQQPMASKHGAQPKIYYATQISVCPPTLIFFVNNPALMREQYRRFVERRVKEILPFAEIPIRLIWRQRESLESRVRAPHDSAPKHRSPRGKGHQGGALPVE